MDYKEFKRQLRKDYGEVVVQAFENNTTLYRDNDLENDPGEFILGAFKWDRTEQGFDYWDEIYTHYKTDAKWNK